MWCSWNISFRCPSSDRRQRVYNLDKIYRNTFVIVFIHYLRYVYLAEAVLWPVETNIFFVSGFEMNFSGVCRNCCILRCLDIGKHSVLVFIVSAVQSVEKFLCLTVAQGNFFSYLNVPGCWWNVSCLLTREGTIYYPHANSDIRIGVCQIITCFSICLIFLNQT